MAEFDSIRSSTRSDSYVNIDSGLRAHMNKVYGLMAVAMIITGAVAWSIGTSPQLVSALFSNSIISLIVMFAPLGFVFFLSARVMNMSYSAGQLSFWLFSALMGLSLSTIFVAYTGASIANAFFTTAIAFGAMSLFGYTTKKDLTYKTMRLPPSDDRGEARCTRRNTIRFVWETQSQGFAPRARAPRRL